MSYQRLPLLIAFREAVGLRDTYGGIDGVVALQAHHLKPETPSDTIVIFMHPMGIMHYLPLPPALAAQARTTAQRRSSCSGANRPVGTGASPAAFR